MPPLKPGMLLPDGIVYCGTLSSGEELYTTCKDICGKSGDLLLTTDEAKAVVAGLKEGGYEDWVLPTITDFQFLSSVENEGALRGTFNKHNRTSTAGGRYWLAQELAPHFNDSAFIKEPPRPFFYSGDTEINKKNLELGFVPYYREDGSKLYIRPKSYEKHFVRPVRKVAPKIDS